MQCWTLKIHGSVLCNFHHSRSEDFKLWLDTQTWFRTRLHEAIDALGSAVGGADGHVAVKVCAREPKFLRRAVRQVSDGRSRDVAAPAVFERHGNPHRHAQVAGLTRFRESAKFADLQVHNVHCQITLCTQQHVKAVNVLIEHKGMVGVSADGEAFFVGDARLFDVHVEIANGAHNTHGFVLRPAGIGIGYQTVGWSQDRAGRTNSLDVHIRITADFELEPRVALCTITRDALSHFIRREL